MKLSLSRLVPLCVIFFCVCVGILKIAIAMQPRPDLLEEISFGRMVLDRNGEILKLSLSGDDKYRFYAPLDRIAPEAVSAAISYEDRYFYSHPGFNPFSLFRAASTLLPGASRRMGASTITMQVARLRMRLDTARIFGKIRQIWNALILEHYYTKQEILEAYFNLAPYGGNIEGIEAAARIYFNKGASQLTRLECQALAIVPQNPGDRNPVTGKGFNEARARIASIIANDGAGCPPPRLNARPASRLPVLAPHLCAELLAKPGSSSLRASIERDLQQMLERTLKSFSERGKRFGINNAAAILLDCQDMRVAALAGSANFFCREISGQVDGTRGRRSPGSALKPFIYALALDQGLIHPNTILADSPRSFGGYDPENFDRGFRGPVPAHEALKESRNLPAVILAEQLKFPGLHGFLRDADVELSHSSEFYGLALALGGAEVTMRELAALYAMLANQGLWQPLRRTMDAELPAPKRLLSREAAWLALWMLKRPEATVNSAGVKVPYFYKTGTSNGMRDAWTCGVAGDYALVVWVGNFDNTANPLFVGASAALPLFQEIVSSLGAMRKLRDRHAHLERYLNLNRRPVCEATGDLDISHCARQVETVFIPGVSPIRDSGVMRPILIDRKTGLRSCENAAGAKDEVWWEFWPSDLLSVFERAGVYKSPPPHWLPECGPKAPENASPHGIPPRILLPKKNVAYQRDVPGNGFRLPLLAAVDPDVERVDWFAGSVHIGSAKSGETIFWSPPSAGSVEIVAVDDRGRTSRQVCKIMALP